MPDGLTIVTDGEIADTSTRLLIGQIGAAHGVRGLVRVKSFTADPADLTAYGAPRDAAGRAVALEIVGQSKGQLLARIDGVADRNAADAWRGTDLYIDRADLPKPEDADDFYHADLLGLRVEDKAGRTIGHVRAIHDFGAGDVLEIVEEGGESRYLPFTREAVPSVDLMAGRLVADPPAEVGDPEPQGAGPLDGDRDGEGGR
ncbi:ribosome maturation factor RimM [Marivibrio halodurans]|uniref:Ribosome maturation factor RimM n=1 Tax=Marivibrio halodurans TaxID=2039722 RepID=A0A8J7SL87_9PROT|nr:ribosome maturation factor RimM [Marivibrio halodurans]MBP5858953.1 ribosome maturation factor RimM [Marivibrio halodurans]